MKAGNYTRDGGWPVFSDQGTAELSMNLPSQGAPSLITSVPGTAFEYVLVGAGHARDKARKE